MSSGTGVLLAGSLGFAEGFDVSPEGVESRRYFLLAGGEVFVESFTRRCETVVEMEVLDLLSQATVDVIDAEATSSRMARLDNVKQVVIGELVPEAKIAGLFPRVDPGFVKVNRGITFDVGEGGELAEMVRCGEEVFVVFGSGKKGEEVFFELKTDELFGAQIAVGPGPRWKIIVPGLVDGLREKVNPSSVSGREGKGSTKGGRRDGNSRFV